MIIYRSEIEVKGNSSIIKTPFEIKGETKYIWYKVSAKYKEYLVHENQDAALIALLVLAMKNNEDIIVKGKLSSKLYYAVNTYLIRALNLSDNNFKIIKIKADGLNNQSFTNNNIAATGISCGVDSLSTIASHENMNDDYKIKYLTYFKAGAHGVYGGKLSNRAFENGLKEATKFANDNKFSIVEVETNLGEILKIDFQKLHSIFQISCVLVLQKLINTYYYSSAYRFDYFKISNLDSSSWDIILIQYLQTETTSFYSSMSQLTRFERTELVSNYEPSYNYLNVCTNQSPSSLALNCSKCEKCMRTLISLELIDKEELYSNVFDLSTYFNQKDKYIGKLLVNKNLNQINKEIYQKLEENNFINVRHYIISINILISQRINFFKFLLKKHFIESIFRYKK